MLLCRWENAARPASSSAQPRTCTLEESPRDARPSATVARSELKREGEAGDEGEGARAGVRGKGGGEGGGALRLLRAGEEADLAMVSSTS